jgi:hypothetical protein
MGMMMWASRRGIARLTTSTDQAVASHRAGGQAIVGACEGQATSIIAAQTRVGVGGEMMAGLHVGNRSA